MIERHRGEFEVGLMCALAGVTRGGFYAWLKRGESRRSKEDRRLKLLVEAAHRQSRGTYGAPRLSASLREQGEQVSYKRVVRLKNEAGLRGKCAKGWKPRTTVRDSASVYAPNLLKGQETTGIDQVWVADITYLPTDEGWLYLSVVMDLHSRRIVGWAMRDHMRVDLVLEALESAYAARQPGPGLLHHSDRGAQYTANDYLSVLRSREARVSMSGTGNCYDNAAMESFFKTLKSELVDHERFCSRKEARQAVFEYIEVFYNRLRMHSAIGYTSPAEFEEAAA